MVKGKNWWWEAHVCVFLCGYKTCQGLTVCVCVCVCVCVRSCVPTKHSLAVYLNRQTRKQMRGSFIKGNKASTVHCTSKQMSKHANVSLAHHRKESKPQAATAKALVQCGDRTTLPTACTAPIPESWNVTVFTAGSKCRAFRQAD